MREMAGSSGVATVSMAAGFAGIAALFVQFSTDIVVGFMAADRAGMGDLFDQIQSVPGVEPIVYTAGPMLFYIGQLALVMLLAVKGQAKFWTPLLVLVELILPFVNKDLIPVGPLCLLVSFLSIAARALPATARVPAPAKIG